MEIWRLSNVSLNQVDHHRALCAQDTGTLTEIPEGNGKVTVVCSVPSTTPLVTNPTSGSTSRIVVSDTDLDALKRVAQSEVGHFARHGEDELRGGLAAVVDTVFNRVAHARFPNSIQEVIDQPAQFSAINATGSWSGLPPASAANGGIVAQHVRDRANGVPSEIKGATHFLNPHLSSPGALINWGNHVVANAIAVYGDDSQQDVHFHGFAPGYNQPGAYEIVFGGHAASFAASGISNTGLVTRAQLREAVVEIAREELTRFNNGAAKEGDIPQFKRVGDYWDVLGIDYDGRTKVADSKGNLYNPPWSSAFISAVFTWAGASDFPVSAAHCHYFQAFVNPGESQRFRSLPPDAALVQVGDIVHFGRQGAKQFGFAEASAAYLTDTFYASHSDIVVDIDMAGGKITTIGGNVSNSVKAKSFDIDSAGKLVPRLESGQTVPWIGVLTIRH